jgi:hypothetical protein
MRNNGTKKYVGNNICKTMTVEGCRWRDTQRALICLTKVVTTKYFPLSILEHSDCGGTGTLKLIGESEIFEKLEKLFESFTFLKGHNIRINIEDVSIKDAKGFLIELATHLTGKTSPLGFPISVEYDIVKIDCDQELWYSLIRFIYGTTFELVEKKSSKINIQNEENKILMEA